MSNAKDFDIDETTGMRKKYTAPPTPQEKKERRLARKASVGNRASLLESESEDSEWEDVVTPETRSQRILALGQTALRCGHESTASEQSGSQKSKPKRGVDLPGAKITAFSTSIFQRMRAIDDINFN